jgi:hypothetical protein
MARVHSKTTHVDQDGRAGRGVERSRAELNGGDLFSLHYFLDHSANSAQRSAVAMEDNNNNNDDDDDENYPVAVILQARGLRICTFMRIISLHIRA